MPSQPFEDLAKANETISLWNREQAQGKGLTKTVNATVALKAVADLMKQAPTDSLLSLLGLLQLKGQPYRLNRHFAMEPLFKLNVPEKLILKAGRQVSKSTALAAQGVLMTARLPYFSTVFVTPLYEQVRRFSSNYVRPFLKSGLIGQTMMDTHSEDSVLQKTFLNNSRMHFTFAFIDCERARGLPADKLVYDEVEDLNPDFIPVISASLDASENWGIVQYSGTPKTFDNVEQVLWEDSSQAEWVMKCEACGKYNVPTLDGKVLKMIQPDGLHCFHCDKKGINPARGKWRHERPDRFKTFAGYHLPQIIFPMHYADPERWLRLYNKLISDSPQTFANEVLGESYDIGTKLLTLTELKTACSLSTPNDLDKAVEYVTNNTYLRVAIGVDWGGGGLKEISTTCAAIVCLRPDGKVEIPYVYRIRPGFRHDEEAKIIIGLFRRFKCEFIGHDFCGAGSARETIMITAGMPMNRIMPISYVPAQAGAMLQHRKGATDARSWYSADKSRTVLFTCSCVRAGLVAFPQYKSCEKELEDFLHLIEDKISTRLRSDIYVITRNPKMKDDMAHAVNYGLLTAFHTAEHWPDLAERFNISINSEILGLADPSLTRPYMF